MENKPEKKVDMGLVLETLDVESKVIQYPRPAKRDEWVLLVLCCHPEHGAWLDMTEPFYLNAISSVCAGLRRYPYWSVWWDVDKARLRRLLERLAGKFDRVYAGYHPTVGVKGLLYELDKPAAKAWVEIKMRLMKFVEEERCRSRI